MQTLHATRSQEKHLPLLVAEDEPVNQLVIKMLLARLGYAADVVATGGEALTALNTKEYALVFMDCQMPDLCGTEVTAAIRGLPVGSLNRDIPIIALTANVFDGDRERFLSTGMNDYVGKPYEADTIRRVLAKWLGKQTNWKQEIFEGEELLARHYGDRALVAELINVFADKAPQYLSAIGRALATENPTEARLHAHTLKGAAATLGAVRISVVAADVEKAVGEGAFSTALLLKESLSEELDQLLTVLADQGWLKSNAPH